MADAVSWVVAVAAFVVGTWLGAVAYDNSWAKDCAEIGAHRSDGAVYLCSKRKD